MHDCQRDGPAASPTAVCANITQTGRISMGRFGWFCWFCWWFWVLLGGFGWFRVLVSSTHEYDDHIKLSAFTPPYKYTMDAFLIILK